MRRETFWVGSASLSATLAAASTAAILGQFNAAVLALRPFTIVRTRGVWFSRSDQGAATELREVAIGACVVSDQAIAIGVTAVPTPATDSDSDLWYMYERDFAQLQVNDATGFTNGPPTFQYDSKAMRKVEDGQNSIIVAETSTVSSGALVNSFD